MLLKLFSNSTSIITLLLLTVISLVSYSCKEDDASNDTSATLRYDGDNLTAPDLPPQTYEGAARFTNTQLGNYIGDELTEIEFYIQEPPAFCEVRVYTSNGGSAPAEQIYVANVTNSISANRWHTHTLTTPYIIEDKDLWLSVRFAHSGSQRTLGCDSGPAAVNGDWTYDAADQLWIPLVQRTAGNININWNIRGLVEFRE